MKRQLMIICSLACLLLFAPLSFAVEVEEARIELMESSNADAWKMLEEGNFASQSHPSKAYGPTVDRRNFEHMGADVPDESNFAASIPPEIPEPTTMVLLGMGLISLAANRKLRR